MSVIDINENNFETEILNSEKKVLLDFWASWCGPCRMVSPIVDEIAKERTDIKVAKVNVDEQPKLAEKYGIMSIPTLAVLEKGEVLRQAVGAQSKSEILALLS